MFCVVAWAQAHWAPLAWAQLPLARLAAVFPPGGAIGSVVEVVVEGADLDHLTELRFSHPGLAAARAGEGKFQVAIGTNVPPGTHEVRAAGRFGISTARAFQVGRSAEQIEPDGNNTAATAAELRLGSVMNGRTSGNHYDFFKFSAARGQRLRLDCLAGELDSKMQPSLVVSDLQGREWAHARQGGPLIFTAPHAGEYLLRIHDVLFRGGSGFFYRLSVGAGPDIEYVLPPAGLPGTRSQFTIYGYGLPGGRPAGEPGLAGLQSLVAEIDLPLFDAPEAMRLPGPGASAAVQGIEYRIDTGGQVSQPVPIALALAPVILENEAEAVQKVLPPCEFTGRIAPAADEDVIEFEGKKGEVCTVEVFSHRLGRGGSLFVLAQKVTRGADGVESVEDWREIYPSDTNAGSPGFRIATLDAADRLELPSDGTYRVRVRSLFPTAPVRADQSYRLLLRRAAPDFALVAAPLPPPPANRDERSAVPWTLLARKGAAVPIEVFCLRREGLNEPVEVWAEGLPAGLRSVKTTIGAGSHRGLLMVVADENAAGWSGPVRVVGRARVGDREIVHPARAGQVLWETGDYSLQPVASRLTLDLALAVSETESSPVTIAAAEEKIWEAAAGGRLAIPLKLARQSTFAHTARFRLLGHPAAEGKELEIDGAATNAVLELDLSQQKLPEGIHTLALFGYVKGQYRKLTPAEVKTMEEERDRLAEEQKSAEKTIAELSAVPAGQRKPEAVEQLKQAESDKGRLVERLKQLAEGMKMQEVNAPIWSAPVQVKVLPAAQVASK